MTRTVVRHSELKDFRQCPLKHRLRWVEGWRKDQETEPQRLGTAWHAVLQTYYEAILSQQKLHGYQNWRHLAQHETQLGNSGHLHSEAETAVWDLLETVDWDLTEEQFTTLHWMFNGYLDQYGVDVDWQVLLVECDLTVPFIEPSGRKSRRFSYQFHADLVVRDHTMGGRVLVVDHKSTKQPLGQHEVDLDDQFGLYTWALSQLGYDVLAPVCSQAKTAKLKREMTLEERFNRIYSYRTGIEQTNIAADALLTAKAAYGHANLAAPYSHPDPRNCGWSCDFLETHLQIRKSPFGLAAAPAALIARGFTRSE